MPLLRCVRCGARDLVRRKDELECPGCGAEFQVDEDVANFLDRPHPIVQHEIEAVAALDSREPATRRRIRELLVALDQGRVDGSDHRLTEFPSFREFFTTRRRAQEMLERYPPRPECLVVELGADHCLLSGAFLDAGCRVIAVDITDHLRLAPRAASEDLCRIRADMNRLPVADGSADLVWATACVHHSWSLERTFREARRVLAPGGRLVLLNEPMPAWPRFLTFGLGRGFGREQKDLGINENLHRRGAWSRTARKAGFEPQLLFPALSDRELRARLGRYRIPAGWAPLLSRLARPLQVSIHMVAELPPPARSGSPQ
ncbi:MAG: class I SAM-dependent methyltransferase [bacterium]|nr:class I SAM-dependent methyltransferase [bacterium]